MPSQQTSTVESLLGQYAAAADPKLAALEQAITERNNLANQNQQLWKLIEKQRAGYNQILKELERVRTERDSYKSKINQERVQPNRAYSDEQVSPRPHKSSLPPLIVPPRSESLPPEPSSAPTNSLLTVLNESRSQTLSRESRISLPDEARQYIAAMGESPVPSPRVAVVPEEESKALPESKIPAEPVEAKVFLESKPRPEPIAEFLDLDDEDLQDDEEEEEVPAKQPLAVVEDFPLPPTNSSPQFVRVLQQQQQQNPANGSDPPQNVAANFRALPLLSSDLPYTRINVSHSFVRPNDRGKEVLSFVIYVNPGNGKDGWRVEKMYSDVLSLDQRVRSSVGKGVGKKIANLPEGKLWKDHSPAKVDQRKAVLENYLQTLINLPVKSNDEVIAFFTSDIVRDTKQPVMQAGHKEGYLTKRGKNFGGWKTRYFVLSGPVLEYFDTRGGTHLGSIQVAGAQIGRQQRTERTSTDDEKEYRHAFLIVEAKRGPGGNHPRHVLCAESDADRDSWVEMLVRYFSGTYSEEPVTYGGGPLPYDSPQPRSSTSRRPPADDVPIQKGVAVPISQLPPDPNNVKLFQSGPTPEDYTRSSSPSRSIDPSPIDRYPPTALSDSQMARRLLDRGQGQPSSLPDYSPLSSLINLSESNQRAASELGHYPDMHQAGGQRQQSPERRRTPDRKTLAPPDRVPSPEGKVKISGPLNGAPIPAGYKFGGKDAPTGDAASTSSSDRREKAKSRSFWGFGRNGEKQQQTAHVPRAVFGVALEESLDVAQIANLPAIVFRCIQYLEAKHAEQEEGIYRLSGSSAVIKSLKDRFNAEGDVDLLASDEYWDPHAIAGLLKSFLRELPASILTREHHLKFLAVIDFVDPQERIRELSHLIAALPIANYSLLRALTAHLILIVQHSTVNKMTMRNVGIVFSPTLGIPAGVFSLMLGEFNRVFNVEDNILTPDENGPSDRFDAGRRNSRQYSDTAADQLLGLSGRTLETPAEEGPSDVEEESIQDESGTETTEEITIESASAASSPSSDAPGRLTPPETPVGTKMSKASSAAAARGLHVKTTGGNNRQSRTGLPLSPRPSQ